MSSPPGYQRFFAELKRRRVFRVMATYGAVAFVVLQLADLLGQGLRLPDSFLPLVTGIVLVGFPIAIVLAWAFEATPEGIRRTEDVTTTELTEILSAPRARRWPSGLLALGGLVALLVGAWYVGRTSALRTVTDPVEASPAGAETASGASIAVLPFADMSPERDQEYFSDGISEELLNLLAKIPDLRVASRTSAFSYKGKDVRLSEVARELGVDHVLEGSVRKAGDRVRITAQLIDARTDTHLWSETWDRTLEDVFAVQDEIAAEVVRELEVTLLGEVPHVAATNPETYGLYLQAQQLRREGRPEGHLRAIELLGRAVSLDSTYAPAWDLLATSYINAGNTGAIDAAEARRRARTAIDRALAIDPDFSSALASLGWMALLYDNDVAAAAAYTQRAIGLAPRDPEVVATAATVASRLGRLDDAIALRELEVSRDPINVIARVNLGVLYFYAGRLEEAISETRVATDLSPEFSGAEHLRGLALLLAGDPASALESFERDADEEYRVKGAALALHALGRETESRAKLAELRERWGGRWPSDVAQVYSWRGDADEAFRWLDSALAIEPGVTAVSLEPLFRPLHADPRWRTFQERAGTSPEQLAAIEFDVTPALRAGD